MVDKDYSPSYDELPAKESSHYSMYAFLIESLRELVAYGNSLLVKFLFQLVIFPFPRTVSMGSGML